MTSSVEAVFLQAGIAGAFLLLTIFAVAHMYRQTMKDHERELARETERADRNEQALWDHNRVTEEKVIPAIAEMVGQTRELTELISSLRERERYERDR